MKQRMRMNLINTSFRKQDRCCEHILETIRSKSKQSSKNTIKSRNKIIAQQTSINEEDNENYNHIKVAIRIRPVLLKDLNEDIKICVTTISDTVLCLIEIDNKNKSPFKV